MTGNIMCSRARVRSDALYIPAATTFMDLNARQVANFVRVNLGGYFSRIFLSGNRIHLSSGILYSCAITFEHAITFGTNFSFFSTLEEVISNCFS